MAESRVDPILLEIFWNRLTAIVTEQAARTIRASFSPLVREAGDLATAIFDAKGRMLVHGVTGTPGHIMPMIETIKLLVSEFPPDSINPGDAFITNDPWRTAGHLFDISVVTPIFLNGRVIAFTATTAHHVDVGGLGLGASANDVFEEGLLIPLIKYHDAGKINTTLHKIIEENVREPFMVISDLNGQIAVNETAGEALVELITEYRIDNIDVLIDEILERSEQASRDAIAKVPNGSYRSETMLDGYDEPIKIVLTLHIKDRDIIADFTGSDPQVAKGINVCLNYTSGYVAFALRCAIGRDLPNNHGSVMPFSVIAEPGTIVNCSRPAPVSARHVVGQMIPGIVLYTLAQALPHEVIAESAGSVWGLTVQGHKDGRSYAGYMMTSGGMGARPTKDGLAATQFPTGSRFLPIETVELESPVRYLKRELIADSGGPGRYRGGLGQRVEIEIDPAGSSCIATVISERVKYPARGLDGGLAGRAGFISRADGTPLHPKGRAILTSPTTFKLETPGGGGYGSPLARDPEAVTKDVRLGFVSQAAARDVYGVVITADGTLDARATDSLRSQMTP